VRVFKTKRLDRWAKKEGLADQAIWQAAQEVAAGNVEANLGQHLFKKRIARPGKGKSSGFRTIVAFKSDNGDKIFFVYGFAKNQQSNITSVELYGLGIIAKHYLEATEEVLNNLLEDSELVEIDEAQDNE
jgi:hypothetical protein